MAWVGNKAEQFTGEKNGPNYRVKALPSGHYLVSRFYSTKGWVSGGRHDSMTAAKKHASAKSWKTSTAKKSRKRKSTSKRRK